MQSLGQRLSTLITLATIALAVGLLYWGKPVLMPLVVATLFTFLLSPVVSVLHRRGIGRTLAVIIAVVLCFSIVGGVAWAIGVQVTNLLSDLPQYKDNVRQKIVDFRNATENTPLERLQETLDELAGEFEKREPATDRAQTGGPATPEAGPEEELEKPVPVVVRGERSISMFLPSALGPLVTLLASAGLVVVLVVFMLLRLPELRNRVMRLVGYSRLSTTTKALDEAGERISRYLLMQTAINAIYGLCLAIGLYFIGLPYAVLWGFLAALMRFIPYVGPWLGALLPITLGLVVFDGWLHPLLVIALFLVLELSSNMWMEPVLYGHSAGVSEVALVVALAFWTWIWGPVGLALATPLTVCVVVLSKYIPEFEFVELLMSDEPVTEKRLVLYQRLLAMDQDEASEIVQEYVKTHPSESVFDELFIPSLMYAKRDQHRGKLSDADHQLIVRAIEELVRSLDLGEEAAEATDSGFEPVHESVCVVGCPAVDDADRIALLMLCRSLESANIDMEVISPELLASDKVSAIASLHPALICVGSVPPDSLSSVRYLCKRIRHVLPDRKIIAGRWGLGANSKDVRQHLLSAGADYVGTTIQESRNQILQFVQLHSSAPARQETASAVQQEIT